MVTTNKILEKEMGNRGSKSGYNIKSVKEQRLYGNSVKNNIFRLRCILKGFEKNCQVKILSKQINRSISYFASIPNLQTMHPYLKPNFVTGFTDAEGSFIVRVRKNPELKIGLNVKVKFSICLHEKDIAILNLFNNISRIKEILQKQVIIVFIIESPL